MARAGRPILLSGLFGGAIPQRRRRVWLVGHLGADELAPAKILFEPQSLRGDTPPRRCEASSSPCAAAHHPHPHCYQTGSCGERLTAVAPTLDTGCKDGPIRNQPGAIICYERHDQDARIAEAGDVSPTLGAKIGTGGGNLPIVLCSGQADATHNYNHSPTITCLHEAPIVHCLASNTIDRTPEHGGNGLGTQPNLSYTLDTTGPHGIIYEDIARRFTPLECERLTGLPDNYTRIPYRGRPAEACGNGWMVNSTRWVLLRLQAYLNDTLPT